MNYKKIYDQLIKRAKERDFIDGYKERHHIIPKSMGGSNDKENLVNLTAREHFIAHMLLSFVHGGTQWNAIILMKGKQLKIYCNSRLYELARIKAGIATSKNLKGKPKPERSEAHRIAISKSKRGIPNPKISASKKGIPNYKNSLRLLGTTWTDDRRASYEKNKEELRLKNSLSHINKPWSEKRRKVFDQSDKSSASIAMSKVRKGVPWTEARKEAQNKFMFDRRCKQLNALIDSVFI